jgi:hypothetical protein
MVLLSCNTLMTDVTWLWTRRLDDSVPSEIGWKNDIEGSTYNSLMMIFFWRVFVEVYTLVLKLLIYISNKPRFNLVNNFFGICVNIWFHFFYDMHVHKVEFWLPYTEQRNEKSRRKLAAWTIVLLCIGILIVTGSASAERCPRSVNFDQLR